MPKKKLHRIKSKRPKRLFYDKKKKMYYVNSLGKRIYLDDQRLHSGISISQRPNQKLTSSIINKIVIGQITKKRKNQRKKACTESN